MKVRIKFDKKRNKYVVQTQFFFWIWETVHTIDTVEQVHMFKDLWEQLHGTGTVLLDKSIPAQIENVKKQRNTLDKTNKYICRSSRMGSA
jgi:hypothetical protein